MLDAVANTYRFIGACVVVQSKCPCSHTYEWVSSPMHKSAKGNAIAAINLLFASSILLSGNNFEKVKQLMEFTGVQIISSSTFHLYQRVYMCPGIEELFRDARKVTLEEQLSNSLPLVLSGALKLYIMLL